MLATLAERKDDFAPSKPIFWLMRKNQFKANEFVRTAPKAIHLYHPP